ncbi:MAG: hypothetical protein ABEJ24_00855 [Candidatus Magasanikbacteria bacterium]
MDSISEIMQENSDDLPKASNNSDQNNKTKKQKTDKKGKIKQKIQSTETPKSTEKDKKEKKAELKQNKNLNNKLDQIANKLDKIITLLQQNSQQEINENEPQIVDELEGVFDGKYMIGSDTNKYEVPYEFADQKKLVEGDLLNLKVKDDGSYSYETVECVEKKRLIGTLSYNDHYRVETDSKQFQVREDFVEKKNINEGDKVVILVPKHAKSNWAAVENVF